jgi:drug/metabolite transporter (DMT)-like permease
MLMKSSWMLIAGFLFALMGVFVKLGARHFSSAELVFYRSLIGLVVIYAIVRQQGLSLTTSHRRMHLWRGLSGFFALLTIVLKQKPQWWLIGALVVGFAGVVLLFNPSFDSKDFWPRLLGLGSGMLAGVAYFNVKQLGQAGEPEWRVVFYFTLISTIGAGLWMIVHEFHAVTWETLPILLGLGTTATLAQLAMTRAYRLGNTSWVAIALIVASGVISSQATAKQA